MRDFPLREYRKAEVRERVFQGRVHAVCRTIQAKFQGNLFREPVDNELALVSCGLLCGK